PLDASKDTLLSSVLKAAPLEVVFAGPFNIGVDEVSSAINDVLDIGKECGIDEDKLNNVISILKDGGGEFDDRLDEINLNLSQKFMIRVLESKDVFNEKSREVFSVTPWAAKGGKMFRMSKAVEDERGRRVLAAAAKDGTVLFVKPQYFPSSILVLVLLLKEEYEIPESRYFFRHHLDDKKIRKGYAVGAGASSYAPFEKSMMDDDEMYSGADEQLEKIMKTDRFKADKGFMSAGEKSAPRTGHSSFRKKWLKKLIQASSKTKGQPSKLDGVWLQLNEYLRD
nr:SNW/SKI-interacting protein-like [Tanacetum cinerariifolium]GFA02233.1 SNW/SKI-interacting protein-like [Tanacetum cinerariifolium]